MVDGPHVQAPTLPYGAGSVLFLVSGFVEMLEVFAYGNAFPEELEDDVLTDEPP